MKRDGIGVVSRGVECLSLGGTYVLKRVWKKLLNLFKADHLFCRLREGPGSH